ncbi:MAG: ribosome recycling factor [Bacilli bacterium]|jgi:ribosome recycling factor
MDAITLEAQSKMTKAIDSFKTNLNTLRTGRANAAILDKVYADYYGDKIQISQIASIVTPEPRQIVVKPYDKNDLKSIVSAVAASGLGLNPQAEGDIIRIIIPALTEDSRRDLVKKAKSFAEDCKISIRNIRRDYLDLIRENDEMSEDLQKRVEQEVQKAIDESIKKVDEIIQAKEKDIMSL